VEAEPIQMVAVEWRIETFFIFLERRLAVFDLAPEVYS
jgi:hypothetical protein